jgi:hypothetical protein
MRDDTILATLLERMFDELQDVHAPSGSYFDAVIPHVSSFDVTSDGFGHEARRLLSLQTSDRLISAAWAGIGLANNVLGGKT